MHKDLWFCIEAHMPFAAILRATLVSQFIRECVIDPMNTRRLSLSMSYMHELVGMWRSAWRYKVGTLVVNYIPGATGFESFNNLRHLTLNYCKGVVIPATLHSITMRHSVVANAENVHNCHTVHMEGPDTQQFGDRAAPSNIRTLNMQWRGTLPFSEQAMRGVQHLTIKVNSTRDFRFDALLALTRLHVSGTQHIALPSFPHLQVLTLNGVTVTAFPRQPKLTRLSLSKCNTVSVEMQPRVACLTVEKCRDLRFLCDSNFLIIDTWKPTFQAATAVRVHLSSAIVSLASFPAATFMRLSHCTVTDMNHVSPQLSLTMISAVVTDTRAPTTPFHRVRAHRMRNNAHRFLTGAQTVELFDTDIDAHMINTLSTCTNVRLQNVDIGAHSMMPLTQCKKLVVNNVECLTVL